MDIIHRPARPGDLPACVEVFEASVSDLRRRHNRPEPPQAVPPERMLVFYEHVLKTGIFQVAEVEGRIAGFAGAILRDHLWFLSAFWTRPGMQGQGVGMPALRNAWNAGVAAGAKHFYVWASIDEQAMAAYMKMGMLPGCQILGFEGTPRLPADPPAGCTVETLEKSFAMALDLTVLGTRREVDHDFMRTIGYLPRQVLQDGKAIGYFYLSGEFIGPAAWVTPGHAVPVLTMACREAIKLNPTVAFAVPGMNHAAIRFALGSGLRLAGYSHLLLSASFGHLEQYIPSGPALF